MLSFFPRGVLDEILNLIESVSEGFPSYSYTWCLTLDSEVHFELWFDNVLYLSYSTFDVDLPETFCSFYGNISRSLN